MRRRQGLRLDNLSCHLATNPVSGIPCWPSAAAATGGRASLELLSFPEACNTTG
ncbi:MAG: hypothetical protein ACK52U_12835 [Synechococcaceae cyanobacterium]